MPLLKAKMVAMYFALCQNFKDFLTRFAFENISDRTKTVLVTSANSTKYKEFEQNNLKCVV